MDEAKRDLVEGLLKLAARDDVPLGIRISMRRSAATIQRLAAEVERLTPREMTPKDVLEVLNEHKYLMDRRVGDDLTWKIDRYGRIVNGRIDYDGQIRGSSDILTEWEGKAIARHLVAEKLLREKKEAKS